MFKVLKPQEWTNIFAYVLLFTKCAPILLKIENRFKIDD
jgi:hypothetical protein